MDRYIPSEPEEVQAMLDLSELKPGELHVDLGCGDGRFVVEAIKCGARSYGVEIDRELAEKVADYHGINVKIGDVFDADVSQADVVTFWFEQDAEKVLAKLRREMKPGSRIVANGRLAGGRVVEFPLGLEFDGSPRIGVATRFDNG